MKRTICSFFLIFGALTSAAFAAEARVLKVSGDAFVAAEDGIARIEEGRICKAGDMLMTRPGASIDVILDGVAVCRMLPGTTAALAPTRGGRTQILIAEGDVVFNVRKLPEGAQFLVDTPTAVAAVRGTQFWGRVAGGPDAARTTFAVKEGVVNIAPKASDVSIDLAAGQAVDLTAADQPASSRRASDAEMAAMRIADELAG